MSDEQGRKRQAFAAAPERAFSERTDWDLRPNALAHALEERRRSGRALRGDLSESNPTRCGLGWGAEALRDALVAPDAWRYEPEPQGLRVAREAIAAHHATRG